MAGAEVTETIKRGRSVEKAVKNRRWRHQRRWSLEEFGEPSPNIQDLRAVSSL